MAMRRAAVLAALLCAGSAAARRHAACTPWPQTPPLLDFGGDFGGKPGAQREGMPLRGSETVQHLSKTSGANATIVALYFADWGMCRRQAAMLTRVRHELRAEHGLEVLLATINNAQPMSCMMHSMKNQSFVCGAAGELEFEAWQEPLANVTDGAVLQDREGADAWKAFGGSHDDLFIYDSEGRLYRHLHLAHNASLVDESHLLLMEPAGFVAVKALAMLAAMAGDARCEEHGHEEAGHGRGPRKIEMPSDLLPNLAVMTFVVGMVAECCRRSCMGYCASKLLAEHERVLDERNGDARERKPLTHGHEEDAP